MLKRVLLFFAVSFLISITVSAIMTLLGLSNYLVDGGIDYRALMALCLLWAMVGSFISLLMSKIFTKWFLNVEMIKPGGPDGDVVEMVYALCRRAGLTTMPEVAIYSNEEVNAFATGPSKNNSLVAISTGLIARMNKEEMEGVLAHEIAHIANGDMVTMALVQGVINAFVLFFARLASFGISHWLRDNNRETPLNPFLNMILVYALDILFGILAFPILAWFSRQREFRADRQGAELAGREKMIAALQSLQHAYPLLIESKERVDPNFRTLQISTKMKVFKLFSTHPPLADRISVLKSLP